MSSNSNNDTLTREQLFACLEYDGVEVSANTINEAEDNQGRALRDIGYAYHTIKKDYSKAMAWYRLAANQNHPQAYSGIGWLYSHKLRVPHNDCTAMEYFLQAARGDHYAAMSNIGVLFSSGLDVPIDKYKALEWFTKGGTLPELVKELNQEGIHLTEEDKNKTIYQLANETDDILRQVRMERESKLKEENDELKTTESKNQNLRNELQQQKTLLEQEKQKSIIEKASSTQRISDLGQRVTDKTDIIYLLKRESDVYQTLVQSKNNEIDMLKKDNQKYLNLEQEYLELQRKVERYSQEPRPLIDTSNSTNNTANNTVQLDNQTPLNNMDNITVKLEAESENGNSPSCQIGNKKRKVSSNDS